MGLNYFVHSRIFMCGETASMQRIGWIAPTVRSRPIIKSLARLLLLRHLFSHSCLHILVIRLT